MAQAHRHQRHALQEFTHHVGSRVGAQDRPGGQERPHVIAGIFQRPAHTPARFDVLCSLPTSVHFGQPVTVTIRLLLDEMVSDNKEWERRMSSPVAVEYHGEHLTFTPMPEVRLADDLQLTVVEHGVASQTDPGATATTSATQGRSWPLNVILIPDGPFEEKQQYTKSVTTRPFEAVLPLADDGTSRYSLRVAFRLVWKHHSEEVTQEVPIEVDASKSAESAALPAYRE